MSQTINSRLNSDPQLITILQSQKLPFLFRFLFIFSLCVSFLGGIILTVFGSITDASLFPVGLGFLCLGLPLSICLVVKYNKKITASKKLAVGTAIELTLTTIFHELQQMFPICEFECMNVEESEWKRTEMFLVQVTRRGASEP
ncbi:hypothetical protein TrST_g13766 [Triparma strigata]|uniref:Uncharacterized protein n=1 Tax=Triparma strigata TaxID=1606541 RepID=A0A9W6ZYT7_9STRA|nr:hypothetical protein TrST_g13766 [Triparma strigata]